MAVDSVLYAEADHLAHSQKSFYPVRIPVSHWQLRHYISAPEPDLLYYASGNDIYCLNTATKKRKHIAALPFEARCTASGYGWVCVGGEEDGHFAAIKLDGSGPRSLDVDSALPIDGWRQSNSATGRRAASVKVERIGEEIVNSISIHRIQDEESHLDDIVAVLTNNDKTVRVYSLPSSLETTVLDLPFAMNHATVSPDGQTLVAVGDFNQAYFFQREIADTPPQIHKPHNRLTSASIEWTLTSVVNLHISDSASTTGYFTTAWSPNGQLVAVGSEGGYLTVFDIEILQNPDALDEEAVVAVVPGSRPDFTNPYPGAVRSMIFSPEPWDLLIWSEDQGRICIGDLRTGLKSRQVINLEPKDEHLQRIAFEDMPGDETMALGVPPPRDIDDLEADFLRRYRQAPDNATAVNFATEYIEARRRQRQQRQDMASLRNAAAAARNDNLEDDPRGLTAREQQILESLRSTRQREEARAQGVLPRSVNYTSPDMFRDGSASNGSASNGSSSSVLMSPNTYASNAGDSSPAPPRPISEILSSVQDSFPELARTSALSERPGSSHGTEGAQQRDRLPPLSALQDAGIWGQRTSTGLVRLGEGSRLPRRRASVVLTPPTTNSATSSSNTPSATQGNGSSTSRAAAAAADEDENPWRTIEEHMSLARGPLFERAQGSNSQSRVTEAELHAELAAERARARSLQRQRDRFRLRATAASTQDAGTSTPGGTSTRDAASAETAARLTASAFQQGNDILIRRSQLRGGYSGREIGVRTAGLAMSNDGRTLWAACEEGIFEIEVRRKERLFWPSVDPR